MKVKLVGDGHGSTFVQAKVRGKKIELRPFGNEDSLYCSDESAQRAWRKVARKAKIRPEQYRYELV